MSDVDPYLIIATTSRLLFVHIDHIVVFCLFAFCLYIDHNVIWSLCQVDWTWSSTNNRFGKNPNLRLFILPVTQAKEAKMPTIPTTKIATSLTGRSVPKIWRQFLDFLFWQKSDKIRPNLRQNPVDRVWVDGPPDQPDLPAVLAEAILGWEMEWGTCQGNLAQRYKSRKSVYSSELIRQHQRSWSTMDLKSIEGRRRCWKNAVGNSNLRRKRCSLSPTTPASVVEQKPSGGK